MKAAIARRGFAPIFLATAFAIGAWAAPAAAQKAGGSITVGLELDIPGFDLEKDVSGDDFRNFCDRANRTSNGGSCQMANVDLRSNADEAGRQGGGNS